LGLTSLIALPADKIPAEALDRIFKATLELLVAYKDQVAGAVCVCVCTALNFLNFAAEPPAPIHPPMSMNLRLHIICCFQFD